MPVKRKAPARKRIAVRRSNPLSFFAFLKKNFLLIAIIALMPVTILALSNDNLSNLIKAAGRRNMFRTQDRGSLKVLNAMPADYCQEGNRGGKWCGSNPEECQVCNYDKTSRACDANEIEKCNYLGANTPTPAPAGQPTQTTIVSSCVPPKCRINYDFPPYNNSGGGDYIGPEFSSEACQATVMTIGACTNNSPAPRDTRPTAVRPQPTSAPQATNPPAQGDTCMTVDTDLGPGCWCKNAGWKRHYCSNWRKPNEFCGPSTCP